jgi:hypothetical protein
MPEVLTSVEACYCFPLMSQKRKNLSYDFLRRSTGVSDVDFLQQRHAIRLREQVKSFRCERRKKS